MCLKRSHLLLFGKDCRRTRVESRNPVRLWDYCCNPGESWQIASSRLWGGGGGKWIDSKYILITYNGNESEKGYDIYIYMNHFAIHLKHILNQLYFNFFFTHLSVGGHLGCFHVLAIVNSAAMNIGVHVSFCISFLLIHAQEWDCWIIW